MAAQYGYVEIANTGATRFTNARDNDMVFYTDTSNQQIHFGTRVGEVAPLTVTASNVVLGKDLAVTGSMNIPGLKISRPTGVGQGPNVVQGGVVTSIPGFDGSSTNNVKFGLSNAQTEFRFLNSGMSNVAIVGSSGDLTLGVNTLNPGYVSAGNLGMFRNRIINGDMRIAQRGVSATTGVISVRTQATNAYLTVDRFAVTYDITAGGFSQSIMTLTSNDIAYQYGFNKSWRLTASTANTNYNFILPQQSIEGTNIDDFRWGTSFGSPVSVSFMIKTNVAAGSTLCCAIRNNTGSIISYVVPFTVTSPNVWQLVTIPNIPAPPVGSSWATDTNAGLIISIGAHSTQAINVATSPNTWESGTRITSSTAVNTWATADNYIEITGVQLEKGPVCTPFEYRPQQVELQLCERYYQNNRVGGTVAASSVANNFYMYFIYRTIMRVTPSVTITYFGAEDVGDLSSLSAAVTNNQLARAGGISSTNWGAFRCFPGHAQYIAKAEL